MPPVRRSNRALKPKAHWEPPITTPCRRQPPIFTIYSDAPGSQAPSSQAIGMQALSSPAPSSQAIGMQALSTPAPSLQAIGMQALSTPAPSSQPIGMQAPEAPYQPHFLPQDRAGKPQNMPEDIQPIKLFQLFFTVKEIENIVK